MYNIKSARIWSEVTDWIITCMDDVPAKRALLNFVYAQMPERAGEICKSEEAWSVVYKNESFMKAVVESLAYKNSL